MYSRFFNKVTNCVYIVLLAPVVAPVTVLASDAATAVDVAKGKSLYSTTCVACHGNDGKGTIPGVSDFTKLDGPLTKTDDELAESIIKGLATPGAALTMPAKGGNPSLTDAEVLSLVAYIRSEFGS
ncbi:MAG: c-type cytochrome [Burkholderiales bacterium]|nr:c-type cytochrome [Burkholderiales bacterium]